MKWSIFFRNLLLTLPLQNVINPLLGTSTNFLTGQSPLQKRFNILVTVALSTFIGTSCYSVLWIGFSVFCVFFSFVCVCVVVWCLCLFCRTMSNIGIACRDVVGRSQPPESTNVQIMVDDLRHRWQVVLAELTTRRDK